MLGCKRVRVYDRPYHYDTSCNYAGLHLPKFSEALHNIQFAFLRGKWESSKPNETVRSSTHIFLHLWKTRATEGMYDGIGT